MSVPEEASRQGLASNSATSSNLTSEESSEALPTKSEKSEESTAPSSSKEEVRGTEARPDAATTDRQPTGSSPVHMPHEDDSRGMLRQRNLNELHGLLVGARSISAHVFESLLFKNYGLIFLRMLNGH